MIDPSTGTLLGYLRRALQETVLPAVTDTAAQKQLKAGIHLLGRLHKTWDLWPEYLSRDNQDIEDFFRMLAADYPHLESLLGDCLAGDDLRKETPGYNCPVLQALQQSNARLHRKLECLQERLQQNCLEGKDGKRIGGALNALYRRMARRDSVLVGDEVGL